MSLPVHRVRLTAAGRPRRAVRRVVGVAAWVAVAAVVSVAVAGCGLFAGPPVAIIGDSITWQSASALHSRLDGDYTVDLRAVPGATVGDMLGTAAEMAGNDPTQLVVNLGSNDAMKGVDPAQSAADFEAMLDTFAGVRCVHLVTVHEYIVTPDQGILRDRVLATNAALREVADRRGVQVIDWTEAVGWARLEPDSPEVLTDTVHLTPEGIDVLVGIYADALATGCPPA